MTTDAHTKPNAHTLSQYPRRSKDQMARLVALDIPDGAYVNLGIGMPTAVANHIPTDREVILQSENGILGMGPAPAEGQEDYDLINAGKQAVTLLSGGAYFNSAESFAMMRGGHWTFAYLAPFRCRWMAIWRIGTPVNPRPFPQSVARWIWPLGPSKPGS